MLSDSLELLHFLQRHGQDKAIIEPAVERLDEFTDKWRDGTFRLLGKDSVDEKALKDALGGALGEKPEHVRFISIKDLSEEKMSHQHRHYRIAHAGNLARALKRSTKHGDMYAAVRNLMEEQCDSEEQPRTLRQLVRLSLGTRTLQPALDHTFGNSLGRLVKNDFAELWYCRFGYVLLGEFGRAEELDPLIDFCRKNPVLGRLNEPPFVWLFWQD